MSDYYEQAKKRYDSLAVPEPRRFSTGPDESSEIGRITEEYIQSVLGSLQLSVRALTTFFDIKHRTLMEELEDATRVSDDFDTSLWLEGVQPLASVRNVRDDPNWQVILFAKYSFVPTAERSLRNIYSHATAREGWENTP